MSNKDYLAHRPYDPDMGKPLRKYQRDWICPQCGARFKSDIEYRDHYKEAHGAKK